MNTFSCILLGLATNLDNLCIGLSFGLRKIKIPVIHNIIISFCSGLAALMSAVIGNVLALLFPYNFGEFIGGLMICIIGIWSIYSSFCETSKSSGIEKSFEIDHANIQMKIEEYKLDHLFFKIRRKISLKESFFLGIALAINCIACGIGFGLTGINSILLAFIVALFSFLSILIGNYLGINYSKTWQEKNAAIIAGIILIFIGILELIKF